MTYKGDPIAEKLDKLAEKTGVPRFQRRYEARGARSPIRFRVIPLALLALAVAGLAVQIVLPRGMGYFVIMMVWSATIIIYNLGPLGRRPNHRLDEREAGVVRHGHFVGLIVAFVAAVLGSFAFAFGKIGAMLGLWNIWAPQSGLDWMAVTFFLLAVEANVAVLAASAATPEPLQDDED